MTEGDFYVRVEGKLAHPNGAAWTGISVRIPRGLSDDQAKAAMREQIVAELDRYALGEALSLGKYR